MMFNILSCLIAALQDKVQWIERLSLAEKTAITACEAYAKWQRSFTFRSDNNVRYNGCQEQSVDSFKVPARWKCQNTTEAPRVAQAAMGHGSLRSSGSWVPWFPADLLSVGSSAFTPCWRMQRRLVVMALGHFSPFLPPIQPCPAPSFVFYPEGLGPACCTGSYSQRLFSTSLAVPAVTRRERGACPKPSLSASLALGWQSRGGTPSPVPGGEGQRRRGLRSHCGSVESRARRCGYGSCDSTRT